MEGEPGKEFSLKSLAVGDLSINNGHIYYIDHSNRENGVNKEKKEVSDLNLTLLDVSLDRPVNVKFSARMDGLPILANGSIGPVGAKPGKEPVAFDLTFHALKQLAMSLKGRIDHPMGNPEIDMTIDVSPFSLQKLLAETGRPIQADMSDPGVLSKVAVKAHLKGNSQKISVSDGIFNIDESKITFFLRAKDFSKPDITFDANLDRINLNRYLPPKSDENADTDKESG